MWKHLGAASMNCELCSAVTMFQMPYLITINSNKNETLPAEITQRVARHNCQNNNDLLNAVLELPSKKITEKLQS
jgi:hypothetical protein